MQYHRSAQLDRRKRAAAAVAATKTTTTTKTTPPLRQQQQSSSLSSKDDEEDAVASVSAAAAAAAAAVVIPMMDIYAVPDDNDEYKDNDKDDDDDDEEEQTKKQHGRRNNNNNNNRSALSTLWRFVGSLYYHHPSSYQQGRRTNHSLPRYNVHNSPPSPAPSSSSSSSENVAPLLAVAPPQRQASVDSSYASSWSSLEDSLDDSLVDVEVNNNNNDDNKKHQQSKTTPRHHCHRGHRGSDTTTAEEVWLYEQGSSAPRHAWILRRAAKPVDVETYMANRQMTAWQEKWNALTMIPHPVLCLYYLLAGWWIPTSLVQEMQQDIVAGTTSWPETWLGDPEECFATNATTTTTTTTLSWLSWLSASSSPSSSGWGITTLPYWPPAPVLAVVVGVTLHAPWSMLYHWKYAHSLPPGAARTNHWSRRMDQAMLHVACATMSYATSGSWNYMMATALFNADSAYRHFTPKVSPRRNKVRITLAIMAYSIPMLRAGHSALFGQFWLTMSLCMWLFATYPIGGWSHAVFHIVSIGSLIPVLQAASLTAAAQESVQRAAQCVAWNQTA